MAKRIARPVADHKEAFFSRLPSDRLTEYENEVLEALQRLTTLMCKWFPRSVSLQDWAERRIPPQLASSVNGSGIVFIETDFSDTEQDSAETVSKPEDYRQGHVQKKTAGCDSTQSSQHLRKRQKVDNKCLAEQETPNDPLIEKEFLYEEIGLRETIFQVIGKGNAGRQKPATTEQLNKIPRLNESFKLVQAALQKKFYDVMDWAEDRATKWFIVERGHGEPTISSVVPSEEEKLERSEDLDRFRQWFFDNLPEDSFTPAEAALREAILSYVDRWAGRGSAYYQSMCEDPSVRNAKYSCIPPTIPVMLWCETRMGHEIQFDKVERGFLITRLPTE